VEHEAFSQNVPALGRPGNFGRAARASASID